MGGHANHIARFHQVKKHSDVSKTNLAAESVRPGEKYQTFDPGRSNDDRMAENSETRESTFNEV